MCRRPANTAHLVKHHVVPTLGQLPCRFASRKTAADDVNWFCHA
jgi:hypothetical protein